MPLDIIITDRKGRPLGPAAVLVYRCPCGCCYHRQPGEPAPALCWLHGEPVTLWRRARKQAQVTETDISESAKR